MRYVRLGGILTDTEENTAIQLNIIEIIKHPDHTRSQSYSDITLLKLERPVAFNEYIRPACLPNQFDLHTDNVAVTGWNWTGAKRILQKHNFKIYKYKVCNQTYINRIGKALPSEVAEDKNFCADNAKQMSEEDAIQVYYYFV